MALKNARFIYTAKNFKTGLTDVTADIRRNGVSVATGVALSELTGGRYELLLTPANLTTYGGSGYYDVFINSASKNAPAIGAKWILENDSDDIEAHLVGIEAKIDTANTVVGGIASDVTSVKATVEDSNTKINDGTIGLANLKALIDTIQSSVTNIQNVTRFSAPIPVPMARPSTGSKKYKVPVYLYDTNGNMEDPDLDQIQLQISDESGNVRDNLITGFTVQPHYIIKDSVGQYHFELDILNTTALEQLNFKWTYDENAITLVQTNTTEIIEDIAQAGVALESTAQDILADTADMQPKIVDIQTKINSATFGLSALKDLLNIIDGNTDTLEVELSNATYGLSALRTQLDLKASQSSVNALQSNLDSSQGVGFDTNTDSQKAVSDRIYTGGQAI